MLYRSPELSIFVIIHPEATKMHRHLQDLQCYKAPLAPPLLGLGLGMEA